MEIQTTGYGSPGENQYSITGISGREDSCVLGLFLRSTAGSLRVK